MGAGGGPGGSEVGDFQAVPSAEDLKQAICDREPLSVSENVDVSAELRGFLAMAPAPAPTRRASPMMDPRAKQSFE